MGRPRIRDYVEQAVRVPVTWFTPPQDHHSLQFKLDVWARRIFSVDFRWTVDVAAESEAWLSCWYDVYSPNYSKTRTPRRGEWHTDEDAREGIDRWRFRLGLKLEGKRTSLGPVVWHLICPSCGRPRKSLYIAPSAHDLACRECHHLRYRSQDSPPSEIDILLREVRDLRQLQEMSLGLRPLPEVGEWLARR